MNALDVQVDSKVAVLQPALPRYRRPFFSRLGSRLGSLTVVHGHRSLPGEIESPVSSMQDAEAIAVPHHALGPLLWMPAMWQVAGDRRWNVIVFAWNARYAHLPLAIVRAKRLGTGVVLWGHGYSINHEGSFRRAYRNILARWSDAVVTYNRRAARQLVEEGMPADRVFVAPNALDGDAIDSAIQAWRGTPERLRDFRTRLNLGDRPTALHVSRLNNASSLRTLVDAWRLIVASLPHARLVIIGDGSAKSELNHMIRESGLSSSVVLVGPVYEEDELAPYFLTARLLLHPVRIGLGLNHAMGYGLPVATFGDATRQNPEFEALHDSINGVLAPDGDVGELARRAVAVLGDPDLAKRLGVGARETMRTAYGLDMMVNGFVAAIRHAHISARVAEERETCSSLSVGK